jgi:hypothetical protein
MWGDEKLVKNFNPEIPMRHHLGSSNVDDGIDLKLYIEMRI